MINQLQNIIDFLGIVIDFFVSLVSNIVELCKLVFEGATVAIQIINYMPIQYRAILLALISYYVIYTVKNLGG